MTILIDKRIGSRELMPHINTHIPHQLTHLDYADAAFIGNGPDGPNTAFIGIERKRLNDFLSSMESGRLANHQLPGMLTSYTHSYVVIEGIWRPGDDGLIHIPRRGKWVPLTLGSRKFTASAMDNFANTLSCMLGAAVIHTPSISRTGLWISNIYRWWTAKKWDQHRSCAGKVARTGLTMPLVGKAPLVARVAMEFKGVGAQRAADLAKRFHTVKAFCSAGVEDLMGVDGVGKTTAQGIVKELRGE